MSDEEAQPVSDENRQAETPAAPSGSPAAFEPPSIEHLNEVLPQYEFVEMIGLGGMGAVFKARQPKLNRFVAIKILPPIPDDELGFAERFEREAQSMAQLSHPHIVAVYDFGETADGQLYFVMEFVEGADLHQLITGGQLTTEHFFGWVPQICDAIQFAHDHGIVHRDIKPANILIDKHGRVKMADFGLAKLTGAGEPQTALTLANVSMGTPDYAAPEQIDPGNQIDWRADIYSLGVVMYQMLTGQVPRGAFPMPSERIDGLDHRIDDVVLTAMQSNPSDRFQRARDITTELTEIRAHPEEPEESLPVATAVVEKSKPKSLLPAVLGLVAVSVLAGVILTVINRSKNGGKKPRVSSRVEMTKPGEGTTGDREPAAAPEVKPSPGPVDPGGGQPRPKPIPPAVVKRPKTQYGSPPVGKGQNGEGLSLRPGPGKFASFRDKLGPKRKGLGGFEVVRKTASENLLVARWDGRPVGDEGIAKTPGNLGRLLDVRIGQGPVEAGGWSPFAVALQVDGSVVAWGDNKFGQARVPESLKSGVVRIAAGAGHALALKDDGSVVAWGKNDAGQCDVPESVVAGGIEKLVAGAEFSAVLKSDGTVIAWGGENFTKLPEDLGPVADVEAGFQHLLVLREDGTVAAWGSNDFGQLKIPPGLSGVEDIAVTFGTSFALTGDREVVGWGGSWVKRPIPPELEATGIEGSGEVLVIRDERGRPYLVGPRLRPGGAAFLRQAPPEVKLQFSSQHVFLLRPGSEAGIAEAGPERPDSVAGAETVPPAQSGTEASRRIADLQQKFETAYLEQVDMPFEASVEQLNRFYLGALEGKQAEAASANELEVAVALREESERVAREGTIPKRDAADAPDVLKELRQTYRSETEKFETDRRAREDDLLGKFDAALGALQDEFTRAQQLDDGLEVKAFREERTE